MTYQRVGPFTDNSANPPINAAFLNGVEAALSGSTYVIAPPPTGTGDDTTLLQTFINNNSGQRIILATGRYYVTGITIPHDTSIYGTGAALCAVSGANDLLTINSGVHIENLEIDGTGSSSSSGGIHSTQNVYRVIVRGCYIHNCGAVPVTFDHAYDSEITDNLLYNTGVNNVIYIAFSAGVTVKNNTCNGGIEVWGGDANQANASSGCQRVQVINNVWNNGGVFLSCVTDFALNDNYSSNSGDVGMDAEGCHNGTISGNTVRNANNWPISLFYGCTNVAITGNSILTDNSGLSGQKGGISLLTGIPHTAVTISGNQVDVPGDGIFTDNAAVSDCVISGNRIRGNNYGMLLQEISDTIITGNEVITNSNRGIGLEGSNFCTVTNNRVRQFGGDSSAAGSNGGIWTYDKGDGTHYASNCVVARNTVTGFATSITAYGQNSIYENNLVDNPIYTHSGNKNQFANNRPVNNVTATVTVTNA